MRNFKIDKNGSYFIIKPITEVGKRLFNHWHQPTIYSQSYGAKVAISIMEHCIALWKKEG